MQIKVGGEGGERRSSNDIVVIAEMSWPVHSLWGTPQANLCDLLHEFSLPGPNRGLGLSQGSKDSACTKGLVCFMFEWYLSYRDKFLRPNDSVLNTDPLGILEEGISDIGAIFDLFYSVSRWICFLCTEILYWISACLNHEIKSQNLPLFCD